MGVPLMVRDSHECALTEAGREFLAYARHIIELRDTMAHPRRQIVLFVVEHEPRSSNDY